jgi:hypothetical protein
MHFSKTRPGVKTGMGYSSISAIYRLQESLLFGKEGNFV